MTDKNMKIVHCRMCKQQRTKQWCYGMNVFHAVTGQFIETLYICIDCFKELEA